MEQVQRVWRTLSETPNSGFFVWEVWEVIGATQKEKYFDETQDGGYILVACTHFFDKERAVVYLNNNGFDQKIIIVP